MNRPTLPSSPAERLRSLWRHWRTRIDWPLLLLLIGLLNVKPVVKLAVLALLFFLRPHFRFGLRARNSRLPLFYPGMAVLTLLAALASGSLFISSYFAILILALAGWLLCGLASHQVKLATERSSAETVLATVTLFFLLNSLASFAQLGAILFEIGLRNPFRYQGDYQKYFLNTGDYIRGLSFDTSTTNAVLNAAGVVLFLFHRRWAMTLLCMATLLLTGSNAVNFLLVAVLVLFFFRAAAEQRSMSVVCGCLLLVFLTQVSPQNTGYVEGSFKDLLGPAPTAAAPPELPLLQRPYGSLSAEERKTRTALLALQEDASVQNAPAAGPAAPAYAAFENDRIVIPKDSIHTPRFQHRDDTTAVRLALLQFIDSRHLETAVPKRELPGKLQALQQTAAYFKAHPLQLAFGAGAGNFSSKLALRASGLGLAGSFPDRLRYIAPGYLNNHLALHLRYFSDKAGRHSVIHTPNNVYDQLPAEYGLAGLLLFAGGYLLFFFQRDRRRGCGIYLLLLLLPVLGMDYWFEQLSILPFFELLLFLNQKKKEAA